MAKILGPASGLPTETHEVLSYYPTTGDNLRFWSLQEDRNIHSKVPQGFPEHLDGPMVWQGSDMESQSDAWIVLLSEADVLALETAMREFKSLVIQFVSSRRRKRC